MAHVHIFGIKIITRLTDLPGDSGEIGMWLSDAGQYELRYIQSPGPVTAVNWKTGIITLDGLGMWSRSVNIDDGGNVAEPGSFSFRLTNTTNLFKRFEDDGIILDNCVVELWNWDGDESSVEGIRKWIGRCQKPEVNTDSISVSCVGLAPGRVSNILSIINQTDYTYADKDLINIAVPAMLGSYYPSTDATTGLIDRQSIAVFQRTENTINDETYNNEYFTGVNPEIKIYPIIAANNTTGTFKFALAANALSTETLDLSADDVYVTVVGGTAEGEIRQVLEMSWTTNAEVTFTVKDIFVDSPSTATATRSWVMFSQIKRSYQADTWPCSSFLDADGTAVEKPILYGEIDDQLQVIGNYGLTIGAADNNTLNIDGKQYAVDIDSLKDFVILPIASIERETSANLPQWVSLWPHTFWKYEDGIYQDHGIGGHIASVTGNTFDDTTSASDRTSTTYINYTPTITITDVAPNTYIATVLKFQLPKIPPGIIAKNFYFGIKLNATRCDAYQEWIHLSMRRFLYSSSDDWVKYQINASGQDPNFDDLPDFYYLDNPETKNVNFYKDTAVCPLFGYTAYKIPNTSLDVYKTYREGAFIHEIFCIDPGEYIVTNELYELAIIIELEDTSITDKVYSPLAGRIFDSTWVDKIATDQIIKPRDMLEHICRLQNFSDASCVQPAAGWGRAYTSTEPPIDTTAFNNLSNFDSFLPANQIKNEDDGYTDKLKLSLCRTFGLINYIDSSGQESVTKLFKIPAGTPSIQFGNIVDRKSFVLNNFPTDKIYPEIEINYNKDNVTDEYKSIIKIMYPEEPIYSAAFIIGITDPVDAEDLWNKAHALYLRTEKNTVNKIPATLIECTWANGIGGYDIAVNYLDTLFDLWLTKFIEFKLHQSICSDWVESTYFLLNNVMYGKYVSNCISLLGMVTSIEQDPNEPHISTIQAIATEAYHGATVWTPRDSERMWWGLAMSDNAEIQTATIFGGAGGYIYTSGDTGVTWIPRATDANRQWKSVAMSSDGQYQTAVVFNGLIYTSSNFGVDWTPLAEATRPYWGVAMSASSQYQTIIDSDGYIYTSSNFGASWTPRDSERRWSCIAMSANGKYQTAADGLFSGKIYVSSNYGVDWTAKDSDRYWYCIALSSDGQYQTAAEANGRIYTSFNFGASWIPRDVVRDWSAVAMTAKGDIQMATDAGPGKIYISMDYGASWSDRETDRQWVGAAMSKNGANETALAYNGFIYTSENNFFAEGNEYDIR